MACPLVIAVETRLRSDWELSADKSGLSKPKQAEFASLARSMPFTAEPVGAVVVRDADTNAGRDNYVYIDLSTADGYESLLRHVFSVRPDDDYKHRPQAGCRLIGRNIVDNMRIIAAGAIRAGVGQLVSPWMWYSHHFSPGVLVDPYLEFTDTDTRAVTSWSLFCKELGIDWVAPQGATPTRLTFEAQQVVAVSRILGLLQDQG